MIRAMTLAALLCSCATLPRGSGLPRLSAPAPSGLPSAAPSPTVAPRPTAKAASAPGTASYYDDGPGLYAAVHSYRWGDPRYKLRVCAGDRCVTVEVRSFCGCYVGTKHERIIDLSPEAFAKLAPLSHGLVRVTVSR